MRIRRCASRVLGSASAPPPSELPPPPPAHESCAGFVAASTRTSHSSGEPCELSLSPWDLMDQLDLSDPQAEELFIEAYFASVAWRASWLFQPVMPPGSLKEEVQQDMVVDTVDGVKKAPVQRSRPKTNKCKIKAAEAEEGDTEGGAPVWRCKRNGGKTWFCRRPASQPNSFCSYHSDQKPKRKRAEDVGEGFYYYAGFGSRSKRHRVTSSSDAVPEPPPPAGQKEEAPPEEEKHNGFTTAGQNQADCADHQPAASVHIDEPRCDDDKAGIAGWDEEESSEDDVVELRDIKRKSPLKKRWKKPVKARSLNSLMY